MLNKEEIKEGLSLLKEKFPGAFPRDEVVVLKKGIDSDILKSGVLNMSRTKLKTLLTVYTFHPRYRKVHIADANRYDLAGEVVGQVTEAEYESFKEFFEKRREQKKLLKKAKQEQNEAKKVGGDSDNIKTSNMTCPIALENSMLEKENRESVDEPKVIVRKRRRLRSSSI